MDRGAWQATVHEVANSQTRLKSLSMHTYHCVTNYLKMSCLKTAILLWFLLTLLVDWAEQGGSVAALTWDQQLVTTARWWWGCTPKSCASEGVAGAWPLPGHLHVGPEHPFLHHFQQGSWTSQRAAQGSPIIPQLLITSVWLQGVSGRVWISAVEDNTNFRDLVPLWRLATTSSNIKLNTLIFCTGKNLNGGSTPNSNVGRSSFFIPPCNA